jgi:Lipocalin-like domain
VTRPKTPDHVSVTQETDELLLQAINW